MDLISKKELLANTGISYGQLYRWKREGLIPEEWFVKQSSYTGQETFFPKEQALDRVTSILAMKDEYSLEELSKLFSPETSVSVSKDILAEICEIDKDVQSICDKDNYEIIDIALLISICQTAKKIQMSKEQKMDLAYHGISILAEHKDTDLVFIIFIAGDNYHLAFSKDGTPVCFDNRIKVIETASANEIISKMKLKYTNLFNEGGK